MATELDTSILKSGDSLYFKSAGRFPYWTPEPNPYVMDKIFENVLEGTAHTWGPGVPETNKFRYNRQWAEDADEAPINASKIGSIAGVYQGVIETDSTGQVWLKVDFPFTFFNRDGSPNHDQKSTIVAWVKKEDVEIKEDMETRLKNLLGNDPTDKNLLGNGEDDKKVSSIWVLLLAFFALVGGGLFFWNKKKKEKQAQQYSVAKPQLKNVRL